MKKIFLFAAAMFAAVTVSAQNVVVLSEVANYIDFQALSQSDAEMTKKTITSTDTYTLANETILKGFQKSDGSEAANSWNVKTGYNTTMPTPEWNGVDSLKAGTMFRAGSGTTLDLGGFTTSAAGKLVVYFQPNGDSDRGISVTIGTADPIEYAKSGTKINNIRPAYAAEFDLAAGTYAAGDVLIKVITNTSNIFGVRIDNLVLSSTSNLSATVKAAKVIENGQLIIIKNGVRYNALGAMVK